MRCPFFHFFTVLLLLCSTARAQENPELLRNGDFETPPDASQQGPAWLDNSAWAPVTVQYAADTTTPHAGRYARRIDCTAFKGGAVQFIQYGVPIKKGATYRLSLWMKGKLDSPVEILLRKGPAPYTTYITRLFTITPEWRQYSFEGVSEENDAAAMFIVRFVSTGTLFLDDVSCRQTATGDGAWSTQPPAVPIPAVYFGMHLHRNNPNLPWPQVPVGSLRLWDARVSWPQLEPEPGNWQWERLDAYLKMAREHGAKVLLPLGLTPTWAAARPTEKSAYNGAGNTDQTGWASEPRDLALWDNYVRTVATHCKGQVTEYEVWNEPNMVPFFSGTVDQLAELTRRAAKILREVDPANRLITPSVVGDNAWLDTFLQKGGGAGADVTGYHFYVWPDPPEKTISQVAHLRPVLAAHELATRPLWNTEAGWNIQALVSPPPATAYNNGAPLSMEQAGAYIARAYILNWALGIERYYFYAWDNDLMGLVEKDGTLKPPARAYAAIQKWLVGARMTTCDRDAAGIYTVQLIREERPSWIAWHPAGQVEYQPPPAWKVSRRQQLDGTTQTIAPEATTIIGETPVLLD